MKRPASLQPLTIVALAAIFLAVFVLWLLSVVLPVTLIEIRYQYRKVLSDVFHVSDLRGLVSPQFRLDLRGYTSKFTKNGITIPSVFVDEPVMYNVDPNDERAYVEALKHGIAHASSTAFPGQPTQAGTGGLGYYFAHSSTPSFVRQLNAVFYLLDKVKIDDEVYIWHEGERHDYKVYAKQITAPDDLSFLHRPYDTETIVLQTCWPPGTTSKRLLVFAHLIRP
jgi:LPXTG-site transpeptidase (sortase) family protein